MVKKEEASYVIVKVKPETRRRINIIAAKRSETADAAINYLIDYEYSRHHSIKV